MDGHEHHHVLARLRVQIVAAHNLLARDRNGCSDPYVVLSIPGINLSPAGSGSGSKAASHSSNKRQTPAILKTVNPVWKPEEATFDFDITPVWLGDSDDAALPTARPPLNKRSLSGAAGRYIVQSAKKIPKGAAAGARVIGRRAPKPMRIRRFGNGANSRANAQAQAQSVPLSPPAPDIKLSPVEGDAPRRTSPKPQLSPVSTSIDSTALEPPPGSALINPSGSLHAVVRALEFVIWDKDRFSADDYLGECSLPVEGWATALAGHDGAEATSEAGSVAWEHAEPISIPVVSHRKKRREVSGELVVKVGFLPPTPVQVAATGMSAPLASIEEVYQQLLIANTSEDAALGVRAVPADQSLGTASAAEAFIDDGLSSGSEDEDEEVLQTDDEDGGGTGRAGADDAASESDTGTEGEDFYRMHYDSITGVPPTLSPSSTQAALPVVGVQHAVGGPSRNSTADASSSSSSAGGREPSRSPPAATASSSLAPPPEPLRSGASTPTDSVPAPAKRRLFGMMGRTSSSSSLQSAKSKQQLAGASAADATDAGSASASGAENGPAGASKSGARPPKAPKPPKKAKRRLTGGQQRKVVDSYAFKADMGMDIIGIVMMEIESAKDLPRWKNMTKTGFDMDPFAIVSFGQRIFRTRVVRHSLNPTWDEKVLFHVRRHEAGFQAKFGVYDWDRMSSHDFVGSAELDVAALIAAAPKPDPETGLYAADLDWTTAEQGMKAFELALHRAEHDEDIKFGKKAPTIAIKAKFTPYDLLRQSFWRHLLLQYDTSDSKSLSELELSTMLDSLGSTLSTTTIRSWFAKYGKNPETDELSYDQAISVLEEEIKKPWSEKRRVKAGATEVTSGATTPALLDVDRQLSAMDVSGSNAPTEKEPQLAHEPVPVPATVLSSPEQKAGATLRPLQPDSSSASLTTDTSFGPPSRTGTGLSDALSDSGEATQQVEQVIKLKSCPLCHMPRLNRKGEVDIVTHLAVCASQDWRRVDSMVVRNFVTASQAHRKWFTKVFTKISQGSYALGANSANIIVQDRQTGELLEEKMQVYVRLGIRLLYQGAKSRMEGARVKRMLKNMSIKQGLKFDEPASVREIAPFIAFHNLNVDEILDPIDSFKNFNEFFYRKLKADARPVAEPENESRLVSGADCRMMAFDSVSSATKVWIKGRGFSVETLLGDTYKGQVDALRDGALCIFRLAPQDYHRFHCPADAVVRQITPIEGQYYTVNPMAIRSAIDVYGENIRVVVEFDSAQFGRFFAVCVGAMMVGSTVLTQKVGDRVKRGDELGYFKFGGSTIVLIFEKGRCTFDEDLLDNSSAAIETLVRVGMGIGRAGPA